MGADDFRCVARVITQCSDTGSAMMSVVGSEGLYENDLKVAFTSNKSTEVYN
jgi:hypothetical protein